MKPSRLFQASGTIIFMILILLISLSACSTPSVSYNQNILSKIEPISAEFVTAPAPTQKPISTVIELNEQQYLCFDQQSTYELNKFLELYKTTVIINSENVAAGDALTRQCNAYLEAGQATEESLNITMQQANADRRYKAWTNFLGALGLGAIVAIATTKD